MARITIQLPSMLAAVVGQRRELPLEAATLRSAWEQIRAELPGLALHVFDERGELRRHVLCFCNETNSRWMTPEDQERPLRDGDILLFMQAVSGG